MSVETTGTERQSVAKGANEMSSFNLTRLSRRRSVLIGGLGVASAGVAFNWDWLTAVGAAPLLLSVIPCLAMCALGLCMRGGASNTCRSRSRDDPES